MSINIIIRIKSDFLSCYKSAIKVSIQLDLLINIIRLIMDRPPISKKSLGF